MALEADELASEGLPQAEAERRARASFGSVAVARERFNLRGRILWLDQLLRDIQFGFRMMLRNRALSAVAVLTLAIGIGACATAFTWIDNILLQPLGGVADPMRLVTIESLTPNGDMVPNSYLDFEDFRDHLKSVDPAVFRPQAFSVGPEGHGERVWGEMVSGNYFSVLGVRTGNRPHVPARRTPRYRQATPPSPSSATASGARTSPPIHPSSEKPSASTSMR